MNPPENTPAAQPVRPATTNGPVPVQGYTNGHYTGAGQPVGPPPAPQQPQDLVEMEREASPEQETRPESAIRHLAISWCRMSQLHEDTACDDLERIAVSVFGQQHWNDVLLHIQTTYM
ncbi:hypothetical protein B0A48_04754 [Cryoendolithus antarcticus]|uniref:Uncharacterized protein n=1 Tax=Cryoendolithus antarcticus TaxID=1507870 RepID=A0A1V8TD98_9PEZI|nr:hypothetical protein B0A48_04754 [Cryoendolithus antarcticus]